jgi:phosphatidylinositol alpha-mannosyltransferase
MRIALVSPYDFAFPGGVTKHITNLSTCFRQLGYATCIIAPASRREAALPPELAAPSQFTVPVGYSGSLARLCLAPWLGLRVRRILQHQQFDVLHLHEPTNPTLPQAVLHQAARVSPGSAIVATFHAYREDHTPTTTGTLRLLGGAYRGLCKRTAARLDGRIAVSPLARSHASRCVPGPYQLIPNGVDLALFGNPRLEPLPQFRPGLTVLFVGRLEPRKGLGCLLEAYARIVQAMAGVRLVVVGPHSARDLKPLQGQLDALQAMPGAEVHLLGYVSEPDLARCYRSSTVFCAPATGCESFGMVLLEAMASGVPIVASDIEGYRSVLTHTAEGLLVPPGDADALAAALLRLLRDPCARHAMGQRGRVTAGRYGWERVATEVIECYADAIARKRAGLRVPGACGSMGSRAVYPVVD